MNKQNAYTYQSIYELRLLFTGALLTLTCVLSEIETQKIAEALTIIVIISWQNKHMRNVTNANNKAIEQSHAKNEPPTLEHYGHMSSFLVDIFAFSYFIVRSATIDPLILSERLFIIGVLFAVYIWSILYVYYALRDEEPQKEPS